MITTLTLTVGSRAVRVPEPDPDHPDTQVWYTADWEPHAWFYPVGDEYWVRLSEIGTFRVATNGSVLAAALWHAGYNMTSATAASRGVIAAVTTTAVMMWALALLVAAARGHSNDLRVRPQEAT